MSIAVSVLTTSRVARNNSGSARQKSNPQSAISDFERFKSKELHIFAKRYVQFEKNLTLMIKNNLPLWFRQISYQKKERIITNGLTIPYLIGIYQICNQSLNDDPIRTLIFDIKESILEECAVLQRCPYIRQYVIGVDDRQYCEHYMNKQIQFENSVGQSSLFVTQNANELGDNLDRIVEQFNDMYDKYISNAKFSWNNETKNWDKFTEFEIDLIKNGQ